MVVGPDRSAPPAHPNVTANLIVLGALAALAFNVRRETIVLVAAIAVIQVVELIALLRRRRRLRQATPVPWREA